MYTTAPMPVRPPSPLALMLALIPFIAICFSVSIWDRVFPMIFGLPFNLAWLLCWVALTSVCMWLIYRIETRRDNRRREQS